MWHAPPPRVRSWSADAREAMVRRPDHTPRNKCLPPSGVQTRCGHRVVLRRLNGFLMARAAFLGGALSGVAAALRSVRVWNVFALLTWPRRGVGSLERW